MENTIESSETYLPQCTLFLSEMEPRIVNLTFRVLTSAFFHHNENFETLLSIDKQAPEKLVGVFDSWGSAYGEFYERKYNVTLSRLGYGVHLLNIRITGEYYGGENYDCKGSASFIIDQYPTETPTKTESPISTAPASAIEPPTTESFPAATITAVVAVLMGVAIVATVFLIVSRRLRNR
ncbi:MAG: hypothetical protein ACFCUE_13640 [Candidatus Bathyarchaeia archaeon]